MHVSDGTFDQIIAALRARYAGHTDAQYRLAAMRVHFNLETEGPVSEIDRLCLGGPNRGRSDADILIDRTLNEIRDLNAGIE